MKLYQPAAFRGDADAIPALLAAQPFATLITVSDDEPWISHVPLVAQADAPDVLLGHLAAANPHAQALFRRPCIALFHVEHGYVSPRWLASAAVPTWNYRVVHAQGQAEPWAPHERWSLLTTLVRRFEGENGWSPDEVPAAQRDGLLNAIVGFRLRVSEWALKQKLSQNRPQADQLSLQDALLAGDAAQQALGRAMALKR